jgi:hypothetical protein
MAPQTSHAKIIRRLSCSMTSKEIVTIEVRIPLKRSKFHVTQPQDRTGGWDPPCANDVPCIFAVSSDKSLLLIDVVEPAWAALSRGCVAVNFAGPGHEPKHAPLPSSTWNSLVLRCIWLYTTAVFDVFTLLAGFERGHTSYAPRCSAVDSRQCHRHNHSYVCSERFDYKCKDNCLCQLSLLENKHSVQTIGVRGHVQRQITLMAAMKTINS